MLGLVCLLRVAGGWVRDKLLGKPSHDVDIALDNVSGVQFAEAVNDHLDSRGMPKSKIGRIMANPDQSKHLETATVKVCGFEVDFVNLRSETYVGGAGGRNAWAGVGGRTRGELSVGIGASDVCVWGGGGL